MSPITVTATKICHPRWEGMELSQKELQRIKVIENAVEGRMTVGKAAELWA